MQRREFIKKAAVWRACGALGMRERASAQLVQPATGPLNVHPQESPLLHRRQRPRHFPDRLSHLGESAGHWNRRQSPRLTGRLYLAMMLSHNHNFMRLWGWQQSAWAPWTPDKILFEPTLYVRTGPGHGARWRPEVRSHEVQSGVLRPHAGARYRVPRPRHLLRRATFPGIQLQPARIIAASRHGRAILYNAQNNINGVNGDRNGDGQPDLDDPQVREQHAAYLKKIVDTVNDLDNVLYEVVNEGGGKDWDWWVVDTVHKLETEKGKRHPVGLTGAGVETHGRDDGEPGGVDFAVRPAVPVRSAGVGWQEGQRQRYRSSVGPRRNGELGPGRASSRGHNTLLMDSWDPIAGRPARK